MRRLSPKTPLLSGSVLLWSWIAFGVFVTRAQVISGELRQWHPFSITFNGPSVAETDALNPFTYYRLDITFTQGSLSYKVPGYFAADGNAENSSATSGNKWRVHFNPPTTGVWNYSVSFRSGPDVATSYLSSPGVGNLPLDGTSGSINILPSNKTGADFRAKGWLQHANEFYYKHKGNQEYFLKNGSDSPENFLGYYEFDNTVDHPGGVVNDLPDGLHHYDNHLSDWQSGDPTWKSTLGKRIIGATNYLASRGVNSMYMVIMNVEGDGREVYPFASYNSKTVYDVSKLAQWDVLFSHMEKKGIALHIVFQEMENSSYMGYNLSPERRLYYREMIARFAHHNAIFWNIGEECTRNTQQIKADAQFLKATDPYQHPCKVHTHNAPGEDELLYFPLLGDFNIDATSLQQYAYLAHDLSQKWRDTSEASNWRWVVELDEMVGGIRSDDNWYIDLMRTQALWGNLMGGGGGIEWYLGYYSGKTMDDIDNEDFREQQKMWDYGRYAVSFFRNYLPFHEMEAADNLISTTGDNWVFAKPGEVYSVYLSKGGNATLQIPAGSWDIRWYNPRTGVMSSASAFSGTLSAPDLNDWAALITPTTPILAPAVVITSPSQNQIYTISPANVLIKSTASDVDGSITKVEFYNGTTKIGQKTSSPFNFNWANVATGVYTISARAYDNSGNSTNSAPVTLRVDPASIACGIKLSVVNTNTDNVVAVYDSLKNNDVVSTAISGTNISVLFSANPVGIGSVKFEVDGITSIDNASPFSIAGDNGSDIYPWPYMYGTHVVKATIFSGTNATGFPLCATTATFTLVSNIQNSSPTVNLITPVSDAAFPTSTDIPVSAFANDADGKITRVEFFLNGTKKITDLTLPYQGLLTDLAAGSYTLTARAYDNTGAYSVSAGIVFTVDPTLNVDMLGVECAEQNAVETFELHSKNRSNATSYNWWYSGSAQSVSVITEAPWKTNINFGNFAGAGQVCVSVNYTLAPWNQTFCKSLPLCESPGDPLSIEDIELPAHTNAANEEPLQALQIFDYLGRQIYFSATEKNVDHLVLSPGYYLIKETYITHFYTRAVLFP